MCSFPYIIADLHPFLPCAAFSPFVRYIVTALCKVRFTAVYYRWLLCLSALRLECIAPPASTMAHTLAGCSSLCASSLDNGTHSCRMLQPLRSLPLALTPLRSVRGVPLILSPHSSHCKVLRLVLNAMHEKRVYRQ